ncbi:MAG: ribonuclease HIII [Nostocales cyanobacterium LacPavin_0920_SED1_MAG_38_18]|nr:ribonuclease HIII [Nostocales cyanobacterium LacPavin_0920_SED1_MAG_38_18]
MSDIAKAIEMYEKIFKSLCIQDFNVSEYKIINYGLQFTIKKNNWSGIVRIFQNKKGVVKVDYSQLDKSDNSTFIEELLESKNSDSVSSNTKSSDNSIIQTINNLPIIGTDESGKGDYFGSLVSASVYIDQDTTQILTSLGVKDSKSLSDSKILEISPKIRAVCKDHFSIIEISPERYNELYDKIRRENKNLNDLLAWGHAKAIEELLGRVDCQIAIVDQFADESVVISKLQEKGKQIEVIQMHKAEANLAVAAASILARERFINKLSQMSNQYQIKLPKGVSKEVIQAAKLFVQTYGEPALKKVAKLHFKTTLEVLQ